MIFDILAITIVLIFGFIGFMSGLQMQAMRFAVLIGSYYLAGALGAPLGRWMAGRFDLQMLMAQSVATFLAVVVFYVVLGSIGWAILREVRFKLGYFPGQSLPWWDSVGGGVFGGLKAFSFIYIGLCLLVLVDRPILDKLSVSGIGYDRSRIVTFTRTHNRLLYISQRR